jgi:branched-chain amino acid transport system ATP-binding protein
MITDPRSKRTPKPTPEPILHAHSVSKRFGDRLVVDRVCLEIAAGDVVGLIGPNGAGKTTLFDMLAGDQRPTAGRIILHGKAVDQSPAHARLAAGLGRTFQIPRPFGAMTVLENVMLGHPDHAGERILANWFAPWRVGRCETAAARRAMELLDFVTLAPLAQQPARSLSGGQRKLLDLARLLMAGPSLMLLDEPAAGVNPALLEVIAERIGALNRQGMTFLIVEHNMDLIARLCGRVHVLAAGAMICEGTAHEVVRDPRVIDAYLGVGAA